MPSPQICLFLSQADPSQVLAEAPGPSGVRAKLGSWAFAALPPEWRAELQAQDTRRRDAEAQALRAKQIANMRYVDEKHPGILSRVWHSGELKFRYSLEGKTRAPAQEPAPTASVSSQRSAEDLGL